MKKKKFIFPLWYDENTNTCKIPKTIWNTCIVSKGQACCLQVIAFEGIVQDESAMRKLLWYKRNIIRRYCKYCEIIKFRGIQFSWIVGFLLIHKDVISWMHAWVFSFSRKINSCIISFCWRCKFVGEGYPWIPRKLGHREF